MNNDIPDFDDIPLPELPEGWDQVTTETPEATTARRQSFHEVLHTYWGYDDFRGIQLDIIQSIAAGKDTLGLMPTGGGKSIAFQVPALTMKGVCIVITPLIALMKDQVNHLKERGLSAAAIYSGQTKEEILRHLENAVFGAYKFLYVSPERLSTPIFLNKVKKMEVCFITVDEAHCISQWGYDFRPSYLKIAEIRKILPDIPVLALTATATPKVVLDICENLTPENTEGIRNSFTVHQMSFARPNLHYIVRQTQDKPAELIHILKSVEGSAIVYTRSRKGTREVCQLLEAAGFSALYYHAGLTDVDKDVRQCAWQENESRVMVATNAFGMGIDKSDVRLVIHMELPDSIEAYFQEAGRAGRDGKTAYAVLLYNPSDQRKMLRRIPETFPEKEYIQKVYDCLAYFFELPIGEGYNTTFEFNLQRFCVVYKFFPVSVVNALNLLTQAGYIEFRDTEESTSRIYFLAERDELYNYHRLPIMGDKIIQSLLRHYCGLFSDYVYIDESLLAKECNTNENEIYHTLVLLTHMRILHYIPRKRTPYITYLTRRIDGYQVILTPEVYEKRKEQYVQRIQSILDYATEQDFCRSRFLLEYFGDYEGQDCGGCDVCLSHQQEDASDQFIRQQLHSLFADGQLHSPQEIYCIGYDRRRCAEILEELIQEEEVVMERGKFRKI